MTRGDECSETPWANPTPAGARAGGSGSAAGARPSVLSPTIDLAAYRVLQEAPTNVVKHAAHSRASVDGAFGSDDITLSIANQESRRTATTGGRPLRNATTDRAGRRNLHRWARPRGHELRHQRPHPLGAMTHDTTWTRTHSGFPQPRPDLGADCRRPGLVRLGLRALLNQEGGFTVAGEAADGIGAVAEASRLRPDVVLMDLRMPGIDGLEAIGRIVANPPATRTRVSRAMTKPGARDRAQPVVFAFQSGPA